MAEVNWSHGAMGDTILGLIAQVHNYWQYQEQSRNVNELSKVLIFATNFDIRRVKEVEQLMRTIFEI